jgi:hypothetical protein
MDHDAGYPPRPVWRWHRLVHVCQRWRQIVFASPCRLDLQIYCTYGSPVRTNLDFWPLLPIVIDYHTEYSYDSSGRLRPVVMPPFEDLDHVHTALGHSDRVCSIRMSVKNYMSAYIDGELERPFPVLTSLTLQSIEHPERSRALSDKFLGGYTPRLQEIALEAIPLPIFPTFIRSASDLVELRLIDILQNGSISAETMAVSLAALTKLECLHISFRPLIDSEQLTSRPDQRLATSLTQIVLPTLNRFLFEGSREYLEEFVAQTAAPQLTHLKITISLGRFLQVPQPFQFIDRSESLTLAEFRHARIHFGTDEAHVSLGSSPAERHPFSLDLRVNCKFFSPLRSVIQLLSQLLSQFPLIVSNVHNLLIDMSPHRLFSNTDLTEWLAFLRLFTAVETLETRDLSTGLVVTALEDSAKDMVTDVLPALQLLKLDRPSLTPEALQKFFAVRRLSGRPVAVDNVDFVECDMCRYRPTMEDWNGLIVRMK